MIQVKVRPARSGEPCAAMLQHPLAREVAVVVAVKTLLVLAAGFFAFGPGQRPRITPGSVEDRVLVPTGPTKSGRSAS